MRSRWSAQFVAIALTAGAFVALPACGPTCPSAVNLTVLVPKTYVFDSKTYTASATASCPLVVRFENHDAQSHSLVFLSESGQKFGRRLLAPGVGKTYTVNAPVGSYLLFCDVPGHQQNGQQATLTVTRAKA
jgi:plastocyanin